MSAVNEIIDQTNFDNSLSKILDNMINGESSETKSMKNLIAMVSQTDSTVLI
jgi:transcriptional regulator with GAF, ATPase, and Fis domain